MNNQQRAELRKLGQGLCRVPEDKFNMAIWGVGVLDIDSPEFNCGYSGCAIGWFPKLVPGGKLELVSIAGSGIVPVYNGHMGVDAIAEYFGINAEDANHLFCILYYETTPTTADVSRRILAFVHEPPVHRIVRYLRALFR